MPRHAHQTLPGVQFFFPQGARDVRQYKERMRVAALAKVAAPHTPQPCATTKCRARDRRYRARPIRCQTQLFGGLAHGLCGGHQNQLLARFVNEAQQAPCIEGKDGHIDFADHFLQQRGGFHGPQALFMQGLRHLIDLGIDLTQAAGIVHAQAKGKVTVTQ